MMGEYLDRVNIGDWIICDEFGKRAVPHRTLRLGPYDRQRRIRQGQGYDLIDLEGRHNLTGSRVAVKIINKSLMKNINMISKVVGCRVR